MRSGGALHALAKRTDFVDHIVVALVGPGHPDVCVMAIGGYGRGWLFPRSDVDLLFVHRPGSEGEAEALAAEVLYPLWDSGLRVSHAVRTASDCVREAEADLRSLTAMLGARVLAGPVALLEEARAGVVRLVRRDPLGFVDEVRRSREERGRRFGLLHHQQEPDLKDALGGVRDLHVAWWLSDALGESSGDAALRPGERAALEVDARTLLGARAALHGVTGSAADQLRFDLQPFVAAAIALRPVHGWTSEDRLMRLIFREARANHLRIEAVLEEVASRLGSRQARPRLSIDLESGSSATMLEGFAAMAKADGIAEPGLLSSVPRPASFSRTRWSLDSLDAFLLLLSTGASGGRVLETMDDLGLLVRFLPQWDHVAGRVQRDPYHRFPVDAHLTATVAEVARLLGRPDEPFAVEAVSSIGDPDALLLGGLLHDIGKVGRGAHVQAGEEIAADILDRVGMGGPRREDVLFLVREHLLLSDSATRRNIEDEDLVLHVAARVGDDRRLAMLYLLTVADAVATGSAASTPWRMTLVRDLVAKVSHVFARGSMDRVRGERLQEMETLVRRELAAIEAESVDAFLEAVPTEYLLSTDPVEASGHLPLVVPPPQGEEVRARVGPGRSSGTYRVAIGARDRLGLLSAVAGAMTLTGLSILTAQAFTTPQGVALDVFEVRGVFEEDVSDERWRRFERLLEESLRGEREIGRQVADLRAQYRHPRTKVPVTVSLHQDASDFHTVVEVGGPDRLGLLFDLTSGLASHGFDVHSAKVATYGHRVVDVFYVTDSDGQKLATGERETELEQAIRAAASA